MNAMFLSWLSVRSKKLVCVQMCVREYMCVCVGGGGGCPTTRFRDPPPPPMFFLWKKQFFRMHVTAALIPTFSNIQVHLKCTSSICLSFANLIFVNFLFFQSPKVSSPVLFLISTLTL